MGRSHSQGAASVCCPPAAGSILGAPAMKTRLAVCFLVLVTLAPVGTLRADDLLPADRPIEQAIDHYLDTALKEAGVKPASQADDATLLRRLTLDLNGRIPTTAELR